MEQPSNVLPFPTKATLITPALRADIEARLTQYCHTPEGPKQAVIAVEQVISTYIVETIVAVLTRLFTKAGTALVRKVSGE